MLRLLALAALAVCAVPSAALANPTTTVSSAPDGPLTGLPAKVNHRLTMTAGTAQEVVVVSAYAAFSVSGTGVSIDNLRASGPGARACEGRWRRFHDAYGGRRSRFATTVTIAAGQTAILEATVGLLHAPWPGEELDLLWSLQPAGGTDFDVASPAPAYTGQSGVVLDFRAKRRADGSRTIAGTAAPDVGTGRVELWGYAPGRTRAARLAVARVRDGKWTVNRFRPARKGKWELYARYKASSRRYTDDRSECGTFVAVR